MSSPTSFSETPVVQSRNDSQYTQTVKYSTNQSPMEHLKNELRLSK